MFINPVIVSILASCLCSMTERWPNLMDDVKSWYRNQEESRGNMTVSETRKVFTTDQVEAFLRQDNLNDQALLVKLACVVCAICSSKEITKMKSLKYGGTKIAGRLLQPHTSSTIKEKNVKNILQNKQYTIAVAV